jgi:heparanase 1
VPRARTGAICHSGGVSLLAINNDRNDTRTLTVPTAEQRYTLDADRLDDRTVRLNGQPLALGAGDSLPDLTGTPTEAGEVTLAPATSRFLILPAAANPHCG